MANLRKAFFFDRDGVVNEPPPVGGYVLRWQDFRFQKGIFELLEKVKGAGFLTFVITNQQSVAKNLISLKQLNAIHAKMQAKLRERGLEFTHVYQCPHKDGTCECRKPSPQMILWAKERWRFELESSFLIGDQDGDIRCAKNAGLRSIRLLSKNYRVKISADYNVNSLAELADKSEIFTA